MALICRKMKWVGILLSGLYGSEGWSVLTAQSEEGTVPAYAYRALSHVTPIETQRIEQIQPFLENESLEEWVARLISSKSGNTIDLNDIKEVIGINTTRSNIPDRDLIFSALKDLRDALGSFALIPSIIGIKQNLSNQEYPVQHVVREALDVLGGAGSLHERRERIIQKIVAHPDPRGLIEDIIAQTKRLADGDITLEEGVTIVQTILGTSPDKPIAAEVEALLQAVLGDYKGSDAESGEPIPYPPLVEGLEEVAILLGPKSPYEIAQILLTLSGLSPTTNVLDDLSVVLMSFSKDSPDFTQAFATFDTLIGGRGTKEDFVGALTKRIGEIQRGGKDIKSSTQYVANKLGTSLSALSDRADELNTLIGGPNSDVYSNAQSIVMRLGKDTPSDTIDTVLTKISDKLGGDLSESILSRLESVLGRKNSHSLTEWDDKISSIIGGNPEHPTLERLQHVLTLAKNKTKRTSDFWTGGSANLTDALK